MNNFIFTGNVASAPELKESGDNARVRFTLIRNEYAGRDAAGNPKERKVSIPFTAFGPKAEAIARNVMVGDQLIVHASISNNNYTDGQQIERYEYNFKVDDFEWGAPGEAKRQKLANR